MVSFICNIKNKIFIILCEIPANSIYKLPASSIYKLLTGGVGEINSGQGDDSYTQVALLQQESGDSGDDSYLGDSRKLLVTDPAPDMLTKRRYQKVPFYEDTDSDVSDGIFSQNVSDLLSW